MYKFTPVLPEVSRDPATKWCRRCKKYRSAKIFGKNRGKCNPCRSALEIKRYLKKRDEILPKLKRYYWKNHNRIRAWQAEYLQTPEGKKKQAQHRAKYVKANPEKLRARRLLLEAVKKGQIKRLPCRDCGSRNVQGHHPNYSRPLEVIWLCRKHHQKEHDYVRLSA